MPRQISLSHTHTLCLPLSPPLPTLPTSLSLRGWSANTIPARNKLLCSKPRSLTPTWPSNPTDTTSVTPAYPPPPSTAPPPQIQLPPPLSPLPLSYFVCSWMGLGIIRPLTRVFIPGNTHHNNPLRREQQRGEVRILYKGAFFPPSRVCVCVVLSFTKSP